MKLYNWLNFSFFFNLLIIFMHIEKIILFRDRSQNMKKKIYKQIINLNESRTGLIIKITKYLLTSY